MKHARSQCTRQRMGILRWLLLAGTMGLACRLTADDLARLAGLETRTAELRTELAKAQTTQEEARLKSELGQCFVEMHQFHFWLSSPRPWEPTTPAKIEEMKNHGQAAERLLESAMAIFDEVQQDYPATEAAPVALWWLHNLCAKKDPERCIALGQDLLRRYPDAKLPMVVGNGHFNVYYRIASCYAKLGKCQDAVAAHVQSILAAETDGYRKAGIKHLLEYEPCCALPDYGSALPKEVQEMLCGYRTNAAVTIRLGITPSVVNSKGDFVVEYQVTLSPKKLMPSGYCLAFYAYPEPTDTTIDKPLPSGHRAAVLLGHTDTMETDGKKHHLSVTERLEAGKYHVAVKVEDTAAYSTEQRLSRSFPDSSWCEPILVTIEDKGDER